VLGIDDKSRKWWILAAMSGVLGLIVLDETVVGVALATIRPELAMSQVASHWVVNAYLLTFTCFVAVGGRLGDVLGHRGFFVMGVAVFGLASLAAGFAPSGAWLIAARALQGIGAAVVFPASLAMMMGPLLGGFFTETLSWRWIFWINLPVVAAIAAIVWSAWTAPPRERHGPGKIDWPGLISLVGGLTALVTGLMQGAEWGWGATATLALFSGGVVLLALFIVWERRTAHPLIQLGLLRDATFTGGILVFSMFQFNKIAVFVFVALYLQDALDFSPIDAGLVVMLAVVPTLGTSLLSGRAVDRFGSRRPLFVGLVLNGTALLLVALATTVHSVALLMAPLVVWGAMLPFIAISARRALMSAVPKDQQGEASGVNLTVQMLGGAVGMALCGALLVATGSYWSLFLMTGVLVFALLVVAWFTVERPAVSGS
jgi:MFS family permease